VEDLQLQLRLHKSIVSSVHFAQWSSAEEGFGDTISAGIDKRVLIWNLEKGFRSAVAEVMTA
jgi:hypothetical protein